jgi:hypothetical protein
MSANQYSQYEVRSEPLRPERAKTFTEVLSERAKLVSQLQDIDNETRRQNIDAEDIHHPRTPRYVHQEYPKMLYHADGKTTVVANGIHEEQSLCARGFSDRAHQPEWATPGVGQMSRFEEPPMEPQFVEAVAQLMQRGYSQATAREIVTIEGASAILGVTNEPENQAAQQQGIGQQQAQQSEPEPTLQPARIPGVQEDTWPDDIPPGDVTMKPSRRARK